MDGTHQGLARAQVEQHVVDDGHVRLWLEAHNVSGLLGQWRAARHVHVVPYGQGITRERGVTLQRVPRVVRIHTVRRLSKRGYAKC